MRRVPTIHKEVLLAPPENPYGTWAYRKVRISKRGRGYTVEGLRDSLDSYRVRTLKELKDILIWEKFDPQLVNDIILEMRSTPKWCEVIFKVPIKAISYEFVDGWEQWGP